MPIMTYEPVSLADVLFESSAGCVTQNFCDASKLGTDSCLVVYNLVNLIVRWLSIDLNPFLCDGLNSAGYQTNVRWQLESFPIRVLTGTCLLSGDLKDGDTVAANNKAFHGV